MLTPTATQARARSSSGRRQDIGIWPIGMTWDAGQRLQVIISGRDRAARFPADVVTVNADQHRINADGRYDSHLPVSVATSQA